MTAHAATADSSADEGMPRAATVLVASTRAAAGVYEDTTGPVIASWFADRGFDVLGPVVVADGAEFAVALGRALDASPSVIVTTGGTGLAPADLTPEATAAVLDRELPGFMEELRRRGTATTPTALLTRGVAGVAGTTFVVNLPGSRGGVRDGLALLGEVLDHVLDQLAGGDHSTPVE
ncbi:molybdenum cofactor biosynthesis protein B [Agromyces sp. S2-1-8]|uniref:MogA/MoaB family molybdenum cofactor biosynthesis protein n=1 Tax=Agromyces sp. S2-1-8 TaxID=2897180 RepID=UPI001E2DC0FA|nr:molybdopterin-binding protein [Agromyces sp. S2-1-8]MCD5347997.1 MogA/MoaB family molybdenum cofactor biosynthesis protein [Agromyces sp. S2-1-8]